MDNRITTARAEGYYSGPEIQYVLLLLVLTWIYNFYVEVHANHAIHGDLTGVSLIFLRLLAYIY